MFGLIIFLIIVFLMAAGFAWLADQPGSLLILKFGGLEFAEENLAVIAAIAFAILLAIIFIWIIITMVWKTPGNIGSFFKNRRREKGWRAIADGVIAVGAGDISAARRAAKQSNKYLPEEPVAGLLTAQTAQMDGKQDVARQAFETMLAKPETKILGLRGLYMEAEATGQKEAARLLVEQAVTEQPGLEWSGKALLSMQAADGDWDGALITLDQNADAKLYDKKEAKRLRAVLLTASALQLETSNPQKAKSRALEAHRLAPGFVPAAATASRVLARLSELRKATKVVETCWKLTPHPELMDAYTHVRSGDSGIDRLKRAETLSNLRPNHAEGLMGVARAKMDVQDWDGARLTLASLLNSAPTERVCLMMSEVEEGQYGDRGRVREWLSRAVHAQRDAVWTADGYIADEWAPISPISGELDAYEWRVPVENLGEDRDLLLEEIPEGPRELPVVTIAESAATLATTINEDNVTILSEQTDDMAGSDDPSPADSEVVSDENETDVASKLANEDAPKVEVVADDQSASDNVKDVGDDPITQGAIDDPGTKEAEPTRKRFKLF
ncbi:MAG: heme biosynthesis HemY N-terminal domain-containing protein [Hyphomicrobiales bacterium]